MSSKNALYQLLPELYRLRDLENDGGLRSLFDVLDADHTKLLEQIDKLYDGWFIETCAPDQINAISDLIGFDRRLCTGSPELDRVLVADALSLRGRKGTLASIAMLAGDVGRWPARATEVFPSLAMKSATRFSDVAVHHLPDIRSAQAQTSVPVSGTNRLSDVRDVDSRRTRGSGKPTSVLLDVWRQAPETVVRGPARRVGPGWYTFDALGRQVQLATRPVRKRGATRTVGDVDVPAPIGRATLASHLADYFGPDRSVMVWVDQVPVPLDDVVVGDLSRWHPPSSPDDETRQRVCLDPVTGRISVRDALGESWVPHAAAVEVTYTHLRAAKVGSGHRNAEPDVRTRTRMQVCKRPRAQDGDHTFRSVAAAHQAWAAGRADEKTPAAMTIEVLDDGVYTEPLELVLNPGESLTIIAGPNAEPTISVEVDGNPGELCVEGRAAEDDPVAQGAQPQPQQGPDPDEPRESPPLFRMIGLRLWRTALVLRGRLGEVELSSCTLAPFGPRQPAADHAPSVKVQTGRCELTMRSCISGPLRFGVDDADSPETADPIPVAVSDSILDGGDDDGGVLRGWRQRPPGAVISVARTTVLGGLRVEAVDEIIDSILTGALESSRRQHGVVRHTYLGAPSSTPRRVHCQPDDALALAAEASDPTPPEAVLTRLLPDFDSRTFGQPAYARLSLSVAVELSFGAADGGEMGALHGQWEASRALLLRRHLVGLTPAGTDIDVRFAT